MVRLLGMEKILAIALIPVMMVFCVSCSTAVSSISYFSVNDKNIPVEIPVYDYKNINFDFNYSNVTFYNTTKDNIIISYKTDDFSEAPDYKAKGPSVRPEKSKLSISFENLKNLSEINIYIPRSIKCISVKHNKGDLHFNDDITCNLIVQGNESEIKINYIDALLDISVSKGNITVLNGHLPSESRIVTETGNISICTRFGAGEYYFTTKFGNIDLQSKSTGISLNTLGYTRLNEFSHHLSNTVFVTLASDVGFITAVSS